MDLRVKKTQAAIYSALIDLLSKKQLENITITELATAAQINRCTLYSHFQNPQEVFDTMVSEIIDKLETEVTRRNCTVMQFMELYLELIRANQVLFRGIYHSNIRNPYIQRVFQLMVSSVRAKAVPPDSIKVTYCVYGFFGIIADWLENGCEMEPKCLLEEVSQIIALFDL